MYRQRCDAIKQKMNGSLLYIKNATVLQMLWVRFDLPPEELFSNYPAGSSEELPLSQYSGFQYQV